MANARAIVASQAQAIEVNGVLRNTYILLALMIACSAVATIVGISLGIVLPFWMYLIGLIGLMFAINATANSPAGLAVAFVLAGFLGFMAGPLVGYYLNTNPMVVFNAFVTTAIAFVGLSAYTVINRKDFSWLGQFLTVAFFVILGIIVLSLFVNLSAFSLLISGFMVFVCCAGILWKTSMLVLGGERNYIVAATSLFVDVWVLFMNLLSIFGIMSDD